MQSLARAAAKAGRRGFIVNHKFRFTTTEAGKPPLLAAKAAATGLLAGAGGSIVGMGGTFVTIPALTSRWIGMTQHQAQANSLATVLATGLGGAAPFAAAGCVDWAAAAAFTVGGTPGANLGARLASGLPAHVMKGAVGCFCLSAAFFVVNKDAWLDRSREPERDDRGLSPEHLAKLGVVGAGIGLLAGLFGVGGGSITVLMISVCLPNHTHYEALGTSLAAMVLPAVAGMARHVQTGALVYGAALPLALGTAVGSLLGARFITLKLDEATLKQIFACLLTVLGASMLRSAWTMRQVALKAA